MSRGLRTALPLAVAAAVLSCACDVRGAAGWLRGGGPNEAGGARVYAYVAKGCDVETARYGRHPLWVRGPRVLTAALTDVLRRLRRPGDPPAGELLRRVVVEDGVATVDLAPLAPTSLTWAGTSCGGTAFWRTLNRTVFQFATVRAVRYEMGGSCAAFHEFMQTACRGPAGVLTRAEWDPPPDP